MNLYSNTMNRFKVSRTTQVNIPREVPINHKRISAAFWIAQWRKIIFWWIRNGNRIEYQRITRNSPNSINIVWLLLLLNVIIQINFALVHINKIFNLMTYSLFCFVFQTEFCNFSISLLFTIRLYPCYTWYNNDLDWLV